MNPLLFCRKQHTIKVDVPNLLHWEHQKRTSCQSKKSDEIHGYGKLPEINELVFSKSHDHGWHSVYGEEMSIPSGYDDGRSCCCGIETKTDTGGDRQRRKYIHCTQGGAC